MQRRTGHLGRVQDAHFDHVAVDASRSVVTVVTFAVLDFVDHNAWLVAGVGSDLAQRCFNSTTQHSDTDVLVSVVAGQAGQGFQSTDQRNATARYHAFFDGCAGCVQGVFNAGFLLFHFNFGTGANLDHCNAAGQLGQTLLQFFTVVVRGGFSNLRTDLGRYGTRCRFQRQHRQR